MFNRSRALGTAVLLAAAGLLSAPTASAATHTSTSPTDYALFASGYASTVSGGGAPVGSGKTAFEVIGCTNLAGLHKVNAQASIPLTGLATISAAKTRTWTLQVGDRVSSWASHKIADVQFVNVAGIGTLSLDGITSLSHAYHDSTGYHATAGASLGQITVTLLGIPTHFPVPPPGETLTIPGLAEITVGAGMTAESARGAKGAVSAVTVHFLPTDTTVVLAHTSATIAGDVRAALFRGSSIGAKATAAGGVLHVGRTPYLVMPCRGTAGHVRERDVAGVTLGSLGDASGLSTTESAQKSTTRASSWQQADVASVSLLGDSLQIQGITGRASASYHKGGAVETSSDGTQVLGATYNGQTLTLPPQGTLNIPGVADLSTDVEHHFANGLSVTALRISLLDGTAATIDLGSVRTFIKPSGL